MVVEGVMDSTLPYIPKEEGTHRRAATVIRAVGTCCVEIALADVAKFVHYGRPEIRIVRGDAR